MENSDCSMGEAMEEEFDCGVLIGRNRPLKSRGKGGKGKCRNPGVCIPITFGGTFSAKRKHEGGGESSSSGDCMADIGEEEDGKRVKKEEVLGNISKLYPDEVDAIQFERMFKSREQYGAAAAKFADNTNGKLAEIMEENSDRLDQCRKLSDFFTLQIDFLELLQKRSDNFLKVENHLTKAVLSWQGNEEEWRERLKFFVDKRVETQGLIHDLLISIEANYLSAWGALKSSRLFEDPASIAQSRALPYLRNALDHYAFEKMLQAAKEPCNVLSMDCAGVLNHAVNFLPPNFKLFTVSVSYPRAEFFDMKIRWNDTPTRDCVRNFLGKSFDLFNATQIWRILPFFCKQFREEMMMKIIGFAIDHHKQVNDREIFTRNLFYLLKSFLHKIFATLIEVESLSSVDMMKEQVGELLRTYVSEVGGALQVIHLTLDFDAIRKVGEKLGFTSEQVFLGFERKRALKFSATPNDMIDIDSCAAKFIIEFE